MRRKINEDSDEKKKFFPTSHIAFENSQACETIVVTSEIPIARPLLCGSSLTRMMKYMKLPFVAETIKALKIVKAFLSNRENFTRVHALRRQFLVVIPKWVKKPTDLEVIVNQKVVFTCQAEGIPEPIHRWKYRPGEGPSQPADFRSVVSSSHMYVLENGSLVIKDVEKQDAGSYLCEASNGVGESLAEVVKLSVNGEFQCLRHNGHPQIAWTLISH
ncbi:cell adhesion molecule-like protein [Caerostris darwini]|uniref:Cell adhesion molecule-like protein n=1 Tax=Caerostris darwini TaxID=1538125 RepID=A0AAV4UWI9_9ARAC|nr:cell adhesion molecule-like protein [Caerostris darwini]